jgi:type II secretory pathway pseudopilin PulG
MKLHRARQRRWGLTLVELLVVIAIMLVLIALGAAFVPRVSQSQQLSTAIDSLEQWLLSAKMRAKRDGLPTGLRFIPDPNNPGMYSQFVYIQQPDPMVGGIAQGNGNYKGGYAAQAVATGNGPNVSFGNVDFTGGQSQPTDFLVQPGDYLEMRDGGGVYLITSVTGGNTLTLSPAQAFALTSPTSNYRIMRQPRPIIGENPLQMPGNMAVQISFIIGTNTYKTTMPGRTIAGAPPTLVPPSLPDYPGSAPPPGYQAGPAGYYEILFAPSGAITGSGTGTGNIYFYIADLTQSPPDPARAGFVTVQTRTGFIGAYNVDTASGNPYSFAQLGRESGL